MRNIALVCILSLILSIAGQAQTNRVLFAVKHKSESFRYGPCPLTGYPLVDKISMDHGVTELFCYPAGKNTQKAFFAATLPSLSAVEPYIEDLQNCADIEYAEPDGYGYSAGTPTDLKFNEQWALKNTGTFALSPSTHGADIQMELAWDVEQGDSTIIVAVIDGGIKLFHPELAGRVWYNYDDTPDNLIDDDGNGYVDDNFGWNFAADNGAPMDDYGHGTHIASIIGANANNTSSIAGMDWNCKLMALKALDQSGQGLISWFAAAIYYAVDNGADVINLSLGTTSVSYTFEGAVSYADMNKVVVVASMMNDGTSTKYYPAGYNPVLAVGATDPDDQRSNPFSYSTSSGSNYGNHIDVVAPGNYILGVDYMSDTGTVVLSGTSQASAHVAGLAALLKAQDPTRWPFQIRQIITTTAEDMVGSPTEDVAGFDNYFGHGRINAFNALNLFPTGVEESQEEGGANIYPNPCQSSFQLTINMDNVESIEIYDLSGRLVLETKENGEVKTTLPRGMYIVKSGETFIDKLIVQ